MESDGSVGSRYLATAVKETSPAIRSYWLAKYLKTQSQVPVAGVLDMISEDPLDIQKELQTAQTFLSPRVYSIVTNSIPAEERCGDKDNGEGSGNNDKGVSYIIVLDKDLTLQLDIVQTLIQDTSDYIILCNQVGLLSCHVYNSIMSTSSCDGAVTALSRYLTWTPSPQVFKDCCQLLFGGGGTAGVTLSVLLCSSCLERALGDVYVMLTNEPHPPRLLKDLLNTEALRRVFGDVPMLILKGLIGPPGGLNLRNLAWHGFIAAHELPIQYAFLLLVMVSTLGSILQSLPIHHRPYACFPQERVIEGSVLAYSDTDLERINKMFHQSVFVVPSMLSNWLAVLEYYKQKRYGHMVCLLLPCIEHGVRIVFGSCNGCPQRLLTAESTTLYTTFDEILSPTLEDGATTNSLPQELGHSMMEMLLDLLVHPEGPRLRDRISHGEVDILCGVSGIMATYVLNIAVSLCSLYVVPLQGGSDVEMFDRYRTVYTSLFHPVSILKREVELLELSKNLKSWKSINEAVLHSLKQDLHISLSPHPNFESVLLQLQQYLPAVGDCGRDCFHSNGSSLLASDSTLPSIDIFDTSCVEGLVSLIWSRPIDTLFMSRVNIEVVGLMRRSVQHFTASLQQILSTSQDRFLKLQNQQLRSRQRVNMDTLLSWYLKKVLQFTENFQSLSSPSKNRWEELEKLCDTFNTHICTKLPPLS